MIIAFNQKFIKGTVLKLQIQGLNLGLLDLIDIDFECEFYAGPNNKSIKLKKTDLQLLADNSYLAILPTELLNTGRLKCRTFLSLPDSTLEKRFEIAEAVFKDNPAYIKSTRPTLLISLIDDNAEYPLISADGYTLSDIYGIYLLSTNK